MNSFKSVFKNELINFIEFKRSLGFKYNGSIQYCRNIDRFWFDKNISCIELKEEDVKEFAKRKDSESISNQRNRLYTLKHFSIFLVKQGYKNIYIYDEKIKQDKYNFIPHIYSDDEIISIFDYIKNDEKKNSEKYLLLFKLLYSTGLRLSEATHIKYKDIRLHDKAIIITKSKNYNTRLIYLSNSMLKELTDYLNSNFKTDEDYIFENKNNNFFANSQIESYFRNLISKIGLKSNGSKNIRIHDLRHSFAVKTLDLMYEKGYDYYHTLPLLSKYMGHKDITHTEYYLRLTKMNHYKVVKKQDTYKPNIIPEVSYDK